MKTKLGLIILSLVIVTGLFAEGKAWYGFNEGLALASKEKKHVVIDFYTDWCGWCKVMDKKTFSDPVVNQYLFGNFIPIRINAENDTEKLTFKGKTYTPRELTRAFQVTGYPSIAFVSPEMEVLGVIPGYIEKDRFQNLLKFVSQECYKTQITFDEFVKNGCRPDKDAVKTKQK
ncbi:MAG: thioredoxin fold domain-containing protein [Candidatus Neomarinimicrobiota bacterium]